MRIKAEMTFLGIEQRVSGKSGKVYWMANFMDMKTQQIFNFYVKDVKAAESLLEAKVLSAMPVHMKIHSFQGKPQVDFDGVA
jgi:hypothetical protein